MNLLLFDSTDVSGENEITVTGRRLAHLKNIIKVEVGDQLKVGELGGLIGEGHVVYINEKQVKIKLLLQVAPPKKLPLSLIIGLPRPKMLARILRNLSASGVASMHLINCRKVEKSYWQSPLLHEENITKQFKFGLEQSQDTILPKVKLWRQFKPFVEDHLPQLLLEQRGLVVHPGDYKLLPADSGKATVAALGPEGGFIRYELEKFIEAGCTPVSLGSRILRVESAIDSVVGRQLTL